MQKSLLSKRRANIHFFFQKNKFFPKKVQIISILSIPLNKIGYFIKRSIFFIAKKTAQSGRCSIAGRKMRLMKPGQ